MRARTQEVSQNRSVVENKIAAALARFPPGRRYLIGVSGGRDSAALLHALVGLGYGRLTVCHLDHGLRARAGRADARFVERLAARHRLPAIVERADVARLAKETRRSIETAARDARHRFLAEAARRTRCRTVILAHHADDQVETFLFNLFRGAATAGLAGMRTESTQRVGGARLRIVRPMLAVWRAEIDDYVRQRGLAFREDASNEQLHHSRNRMRHQIIPALENFFGRDIRKSIWRTAEILAAEDDWISSMIDVDSRELSVARLREMPAALQRRFIHTWLKKMKAPDVGFDEIEAVRALMPQNAKAAKINLPGDLHARRRAGKIFIERSASRG
jgi:tRNA(Ile)-lysidine synthase